MIPSRPLDIGAIIGESIRIIRSTWVKITLLTLLCLTPAWIALYWGTMQAGELLVEWMQHHELTSSEGEKLVHDYIIVSQKNRRASIYNRFLASEETSIIDSVYEEMAAGIPEADRKQVLEARLDSMEKAFTDARPGIKSKFSLSIIWEILACFIPWIVLLLVGAFVQIASILDLTCRSFEERQLLLGRALLSAIKRNAWLLMAQVLLILLSMVLGMGLVAGIGFAVSIELGLLCLAISFILMGISGIRVLFAQVALVSEEKGPFVSAVRSVELTKGNFWRIVGIGFVVLIIISIVSNIISLPFSMFFAPNNNWLYAYLRGTDMHLANGLPWLEIIVGSFVITQAIVTALTAAFSPAFVTTFYYDLRTRLDGPLDYHAPEPSAPPESSPEIFLQ